MQKTNNSTLINTLDSEQQAILSTALIINTAYEENLVGIKIGFDKLCNKTRKRYPIINEMSISPLTFFEIAHREVENIHVDNELCVIIPDSNFTHSFNRAIEIAKRLTMKPLHQMSTKNNFTASEEIQYKVLNKILNMLEIVEISKEAKYDLYVPINIQFLVELLTVECDTYFDTGITHTNICESHLELGIRRTPRVEKIYVLYLSELMKTKKAELLSANVYKDGVQDI